jgi:hypothetical protein
MKQKAAVSIYLVIIILTGVLMIATAVSSFMLLQQKMSVETGLSNQAYQAADTGAEWALYQINKFDYTTLSSIKSNNSGLTFQCSVGSIAVGSCSYCLIFTPLDPLDENGPISTVKSVGKCGNVARAIELTF